MISFVGWNLRWDFLRRLVEVLHKPRMSLPIRLVLNAILEVSLKVMKNRAYIDSSHPLKPRLKDMHSCHCADQTNVTSCLTRAYWFIYSEQINSDTGIGISKVQILLVLDQ